MAGPFRLPEGAYAHRPAAENAAFVELFRRHASWPDGEHLKRIECTENVLALIIL